MTISATPPAPLSAEDYEAERQREEVERFNKNGAGQPLSMLGRELPHAIEAEEYLISCALLDGKLIVERARQASVSSNSFYDQKHGTVWRAIERCVDRKEPMDPTGTATDANIAIVAQDLKDRGELDGIGSYSFLLQCSAKMPTTAQASAFIKTVRNYELVRNLIHASRYSIEDAYNFSGEIDELLSIYETRMAPILRHRGATSQTYTVWSPAKFREWQPSLEANLLGAGYLRRRQITTLIGPPGVGKSRLSLWLAVSHIAGRTWANLDPKGGALRWFMIGNENDPERQKRDLDWFYRSLSAEEQAKVDAQLFMHVLDSHEDAQMTLTDPGVYARMVATLKIVKPDVMVCDPWGNMIESNENDNEEVRRTLKMLLRAVSEGAPDAAVLIIHHARTGKTNTIEAGNNYSGGSLGRGSKVLVSQARCELALWPGDSEDASKLVLTCEKVNNAPKFEPVGLTFENGIYAVDSSFSVKGWRDDIEGKRSKRLFTVKDVVELVRQGSHKPKDIVALAAEPPFGTVRSTVYERLKEACDKGYLVNSKGEYSIPTGRLTQSDLAGMRDDGPLPVNPNDPTDTM